MKKFNLKWRVLPILASLCFVSCNNEEDAPIPTLSVSPTSITLSGSGENDFFDIESNTDWTIEVDANWVEISKQKGSGNASVKVSADENPKETSRTAILVVTAGNLRDSVKITQEAGLIPGLSVSSTSITLSGSGENDFFDIESNIDWTIEVGDDWVTVSQEKGSGNASIEVRAAENPKESKRTTNITVTAGDLSQSIRVTQEAGEILRVSPTDLQVSADIKENAGSFTIQISSAWSISGIESVSWLSLSATEGIGNTTITVNTTERNMSVKPRSVTLTITSGTKSSKITITQITPYADLHVEFTNELSLSTQFYIELAFDNNVAGYFYTVFKAADIEQYTETDLYDYILTKESNSTKDTDMYFINLSPKTEYIYCCIPYMNENGNRKNGPLFTYKIQTKEDVTDYDAFIDYLSYSYSSEKWMATYKMAGSCKRYYTIASFNSGADGIYNMDNIDILLATTIRDYINANQIKNNINSGEYPIEHSDYATSCFVATWGVNENGEFAPHLCHKYRKIYNSNSATANAQNKEMQPIKNLTRQQLDELSKNLHIIKVE